MQVLVITVETENHPLSLATSNAEEFIPSLEAFFLKFLRNIEEV